MQRRRFLSAAATGAAVGLAACAKGRSAELQLIEPASQFDRAAFEKIAAVPADIRQAWDGRGYHPEILGNIKNAYNGYQFGFGIKPERISIALVLHGDGTAYAYDDATWQKYKIGESLGLKDPSGNYVTTNVFAHARSAAETAADPNDPKGMYQDATVEALQRRRLAVMVCHVAVAQQARVLASSGIVHGMSAQEILSDLASHLIPGVLVVPSGVSAIGLLQHRYGYVYATS
jgi:intracellular sulfur oxidation DsrE/DsrF family protein